MSNELVSTFSDQTASRIEVAASAALAEHRVLAPAQRIGYDLPMLGVSADVPEQPIYAKTPSGTWAYGTDYRSDPAAEQYGGRSPVPTSILDSLRELHGAGVRADDLWIVHEIEEDWQPGQPLPPTAPPSRRTRRHNELLIGLTEQMKRGLLVAGAILGAVAVAPAALLVAAPAPAVGLDPVIVAGVRHPDGPCAWVVLAAWQWE